MIPDGETPSLIRPDMSLEAIQRQHVIASQDVQKWKGKIRTHWQIMVQRYDRPLGPGWRDDYVELRRMVRALEFAENRERGWADQERRSLVMQGLQEKS